MIQEQEYIENIIDTAIVKLKRAGLITVGVSSFKKTEQLLYNYKSFVASIEDKKEYVRELREHGLEKRSASITSYGGNTGFGDSKSDSEKLEEQILRLCSQIELTERELARVNRALDGVRNDPYFDIIELKYFNGLSQKEIADKFNVDTGTISRNKNRLVNRLKIDLFPDESIMELVE